MQVYFKKLNSEAVLPERKTKFAAGVDLVCIRKIKDVSEKIAMYGTGLSVQVPDGYYTEIVARSSIYKTGYIISNCVGIIDEDYRGELCVCLTRVDSSLPELTLPFCLTQLILKKAEYFECTEVDELDKSERGEGGFGSTDKASSSLSTQSSSC